MGEREDTSGNLFMIITVFVLSMESKSSLNIDMLQFLWGHRLSFEEGVTKWQFWLVEKDMCFKLKPCL